MTASTDNGLMAVGPVKTNLGTKPNALLWQWEEDQPIAWRGASEFLLEDLLGEPRPDTARRRRGRMAARTPGERSGEIGRPRSRSVLRIAASP